MNIDKFAESVKKIHRKYLNMELGFDGIQLRHLGNDACVAYLPLLCQGSKWLSGKSVWHTNPSRILEFLLWIYFYPPKNQYKMYYSFRICYM